MELLGQDNALNQLKKFVAAGRVAGAFLFCGPAGTGKALAAKTFAKILNCQDATARDKQTFCGQCLNCKSIENGTHPDFVFADFAYQASLTGKEEEKQQHINVGTIRKITASSQQKAALGGWKIMVVDRAETMEAEAQNALLKFIEEPPAKTVWILISSRKSALLPTIISRSQILNFAPLEDAVLEKILAAQGLGQGGVREVLKFASGSVSRAMEAARMLENISALDALSPSFPFEAAMTLDKTLASARREARLLLDMFSASLHEEWRKETGAKKEELSAALKKNAHYKSALNRNVSPYLVLETAFMQNSNLLSLVF